MLLFLDKCKSILILGCGDGHDVKATVDFLKQREMLDGVSIVAIDQSATNITRAHQLMTKIHP